MESGQRPGGTDSHFLGHDGTLRKSGADTFLCMTDLVDQFIFAGVFQNDGFLPRIVEYGFPRFPVIGKFCIALFSVEQTGMDRQRDTA